MKTAETATAPCRRCGTCCRKGGPALHVEDRALFEGSGAEGALKLSLIVTLRPGELALDQLQGRILPLKSEVLKLRGAGDFGSPHGNACALFDPAANACALYERRPAECRALSCQDTAALAAMYASERLARADLLPVGHGLLAVLAEHEGLVPAARIRPLASALRSGDQEALDAEEELTRMALADRAFRKALTERAGIGPDYHDFFLGRDVGVLFAAAGLILRADARTGLRVQPDPLHTSPLSPED